jgi:hypothetical protein
MTKQVFLADSAPNCTEDRTPEIPRSSAFMFYLQALEKATRQRIKIFHDPATLVFFFEKGTRFRLDCRAVLDIKEMSSRSQFRRS